ncbi:MAG: hypothetical protein E8D45_10715 [Nitrospira sp.]|nr:MAG: hypothetical protein E8D45_10715 [Nitrospira sp.]
MSPLIRARPLLLLLCGPLLVGCTSWGQSPNRGLSHTVTPSVQIPSHVERLAVLYPKTYTTKELLNGYLRLEAATFQIKSQRPGLRIVDRFHLPELLGEQRFQLAASVDDESAVRIGRLLGIDSVVIYGIEMPGLRERVMARLYGDLPPVMVTTKLLKIETGEVLYYNVVMSHVQDPQGWWTGFDNGRDMHPDILAALDRGLRLAMEDLRAAFR